MIEISVLGREQYALFCERNPEFHDSDAGMLLRQASDYQLVDGDVVVADAQVTRKSVDTWGENCWLQFGQYGFRDQAALKALFTNLAQAESDRGVRQFYVEVAAGDEHTVKSWFELGFGLQHVSGIQRRPEALGHRGAHVARELRETDLEGIAHLERELTIHQAQSPVFSKLAPQSVEEIVSEWRDELHTNEIVTRVVEVDGSVVGFAYGCSTEKSGLHSGLLRPRNSATFAFCAVSPEFRRRGIAAVLATAVIQELKARGFDHVVTDWRATNQLSSNTWPKLGFEPTVFRLHRAI